MLKERKLTTKQMSTITNRLRNYFDNTSSEKIKEDWAKTKELDNCSSPTVEYFLESHMHYHFIDDDIPDFKQQSFFNNLESPNFSSDFFFDLNLWKKQLFQ